MNRQIFFVLFFLGFGFSALVPVNAVRANAVDTVDANAVDAVDAVWRRLSAEEMLYLPEENLIDYCETILELQTLSVEDAKIQRGADTIVDIFVVQRAFLSEHEHQICNGERDLEKVQPTPIGDE